MHTTTDEISTKSFKDDMFVSGRLSQKLIIETNSSSVPECYHAGVRATVPFVWEYEPGTPKHRLVQVHTSMPLPPLTPPPCYFFTSTTTMPIRKHSTRMHMHSNNSLFPKFSFIRSLSTTAVRLSSSSSEKSVKSLSSSPSSLSSTSPASVPSFQMTPLCDYYYSRRYGFAFEADQEEECISSSSFTCFRSKKCNRKNNAKRSDGRYSSIVRRFLPPVCFSLIRGAA